VKKGNRSQRRRRRRRRSTPIRKGPALRLVVLTGSALPNGESP